MSRIGFEVELLAPRGRSRADLARAVAGAVGGAVVPAFHRDSEPSAVPGMGVFRHLTPRFDVVDAERRGVCSIVDDVTVVEGLDPRAAALPGWYRLLTDDARLLALLDRTCDPSAPLDHVLDPVAALFGTSVQRLGESVRKVCDQDGRSVAMATLLVGERHRPAEIITPPVALDHDLWLERVLGPARELGFTVPVEAAVHLHFDAAPFRTPRALANLVVLFAAWRGPLHEVLGTNRACRRLGPPHDGLVHRVDALRRLDDWSEVGALLTGVELSKFCDVNLRGLLRLPASKDTVEVRILPGSLHTEKIVRAAALVEGLLERCRTIAELGPPTGRPRSDMRTLIGWGAGGW